MFLKRTPYGTGIFQLRRGPPCAILGVRSVNAMELRVLRYFLVVAREENITRAAALLHVTQPTLSRQLM